MYVIMFDESYFQLYKTFLIVMLILVVIAVAVALFIERRKAKERHEFFTSLAPLKVPKAEVPESTPSPLTTPKVEVPKSTSSPLKAPKASQDV